MADIKISDLPDGGDTAIGDTTVIVRGGVTLRGTFPGQLVSYTWNRTGNTAVGNKLMIGDLEDMLLAYDVELIAASVIRTDTDTANIEILNGATTIRTIVTSAVSVIDNFAGIACAASDVISVRNNSGGNVVTNCGVTLTFRLT